MNIRNLLKIEKNPHGTRDVSLFILAYWWIGVIMDDLTTGYAVTNFGILIEKNLMTVGAMMLVGVWPGIFVIEFFFSGTAMFLLLSGYILSTRKGKIRWLSLIPLIIVSGLASGRLAAGANNLMWLHRFGLI